MFDLMTQVFILESNIDNNRYSTNLPTFVGKKGTIVHIYSDYRAGESLYGVSIPSMGYAVEWFTEDQIAPLKEKVTTFSDNTIDDCIDYGEEETAVQLANSIFAEPMNVSTEYNEEDNSDVQ